MLPIFYKKKLSPISKKLRHTLHGTRKHWPLSCSVLCSPKARPLVAAEWYSMKEMKNFET